MECTGFIDGINGGAVIGWVRVGDGTTPAVIDVLINGHKVATGISADQHRADVADAGFGSGYHGFSCVVAEDRLRALAADHAADIHVELRLSGSDQLLMQQHLSLRPPDADHSAIDEARQGRQVMASVLQAPEVAPHPGYKARIEAITDGQLRGWAVDLGDPDRILKVDVLIDGVFLCHAHADQSRADVMRNGLSNGRGGLRFPLPLDLLPEGVRTVSLCLPDGSLVDHQVNVPHAKVSLARHTSVGAIRPEDVTVIVPVYNAADDVAVCVERLASHSPAGVDILFIDDASPDPAIGGLLARAATRPGMRVLRNAENLGFTRTINRGIGEAGRRHVVLLNSDARVTPGWLEGMLTAAASRPRVATVTAMSDRAGAFSAPNIGNENTLPPGVDELTFARAFRRRALGIYPAVPTGNGFCMFINRACLDAVGALDAEAFPRGYGEENDFCMRAGRAGWRHLIDDRTYVFHDRSKSFGEAKTDLMRAGRAVIDARYPEYKLAIRAFSYGAKLAVARMQARLALRDCLDPRATLPRVLYVVATQTGGTPQTNLDLMNAISPDCDPWLMRCDSRRMVLMRWQDGTLHEVAQHSLDDEIEPIRHQSDDYDRVLADWLRQHDIATVHVRHLAWHSINLPQVARAQGCRVVFSFHDFYTLCPSIKLLTAQGEFYGGDLDNLQGEVVPELWPDGSMPPANADWIRWWRERFGRALADCDAYVTTSDSARDTILRHLPGIKAEKFHVIPHGRDFAEFAQLRQRPRHGQPVRILVPGNISRAKGLDTIRALLEADASGLLEFHILGKLDNTLPFDHPRLIQHGTYARDQFAARVRALNIHLGAVFSIWDETWCHTLTELWSVGVPAMVFDFSTVATRVGRTGNGWVLPHGDIAALYRRIVDLAFDMDEQNRADAALAAWQAGPAVANSTHLMAARYLEVYRVAAGGSGKRPMIGVTGLASPTLDKGNASTEIRLWTRTRNTGDRPVVYVRMTSAALLENLRSGMLDGALIQRNAIPETMVAPLLAAMQAAGTGYALDLDDDLLEVPADKDPSGNYRAYASLLKDLVGQARLVTASTPALAARLRPLNLRTHLLEDRLDEALWRGPLPVGASRNGFTALYMGTKTHAADLTMIAPALAATAAQHPDFRLAVIGVQDGDLPPWAWRVDVPESARSYQRFVPWLKSLAARFDLAIAPLEDTPFNRHKSGLKLLDMLGLGLPVLASDVAPYREESRNLDGITLIANTVADWQEALTAHLQKPPLSPAERDSLRQSVLQKAGLAVALPGFDAMLTAVLTGDRRPDVHGSRDQKRPAPVGMNADGRLLHEQHAKMVDFS